MKEEGGGGVRAGIRKVIRSLPVETRKKWGKEEKNSVDVLFGTQQRNIGGKRVRALQSLR